MKPSTISYHTATGDVTGTTAFVRSFVLTASNAVATAELRAGSSNGDLLASLCTGSNSTVSADLYEAQFVGGVHVTITGTGAAVTVVYT